MPQPQKIPVLRRYLRQGVIKAEETREEFRERERAFLDFLNTNQLRVKVLVDPAEESPRYLEFTLKSLSDILLHMDEFYN